MDANGQLRVPSRLGWVKGAFSLGVISLFAACGDDASMSAPLVRAPEISSEVDGVIWEAGNWKPHLAAGEEGVSWGNHRAVVALEDPAGALGAEATGGTGLPEAVRVTIPWRRHDPDPASRGIIVVDATTGEPVANAVAIRVENTSGEVIFQPNPGSSTYYVYYLPWQSTGGYYPTITYPTPAELRTPAAGGQERGSPSRADQGGRATISWAGKVSVNDPAWETRVRRGGLGQIPEARTTHIQSVTDFHAFFPMEVIATPEETEAFLAGATQGWAVVPEHRDHPVRMRHFIPQHWVGPERASRMPILRGVSAETSAGSPPGLPAPPLFTARVLRDESFTFQLALVSGGDALSDVGLTFDGFPPAWTGATTCFNCGGINEKGEVFTKEVSVPPHAVQPLWVGIRIPQDQPPGIVEGTVTVSTANRGAQTVRVALEIQEARAINHGFDEPELQTRLAWLNSTVGTDPDFIIEPFEPVGVEETSGEGGHALTVLGRRIEVGPLGLPTQIFSYFTPELTYLSDTPEPILARPITLNVRKDPSSAGSNTGLVESFTSTPFEVINEARGRARWNATSRSDIFDMTVEGRLEYDGMLDYHITLVAREDAVLSDIALPVALVPDAAEYMLGLGRKGGKRPASVDWKWAVENHQEGVWLGGVNKGLQYVLRDENYVRPLNTNFYRNQPLNMPPSWFNGGRGGIRIFEEGGRGDAGGRAGEAPGSGYRDSPSPPRAARPAAVVAQNYSGPRTVSTGDTLHFNVRFLITPFRTLDTQAHFDTRFVHMYVPVDSVKAWGGTVVNIHHANEINPYINYPFYALEAQGAYIDEAHEKGIKVKLYNTIRELTYKACELFALRSLGEEILNDGEGGGHSWMQEHLQDHYHSAWHAARTDDAAMLDKGTSRWTNYYVEGINWLAEHQHIDGLYLDDIAFSRETVKRIVSVLAQHRDQVVIDLHSANQFNIRDGFTNSAMLYMEHFPFITRLWFGEYFEYDLDPDYWMTEVSGLPFGLMGEMLQDGGHPYRGMLYGMTARMYGNVDPRPVWAMMNDFGMAESRMLGYWLNDTPVRTNTPGILATTYIRPDRALIALASWSKEDEIVDLSVDLEAMGPVGAGRVYAPAVDGLQEEEEVDLSRVRVPAGMGLWVVIQK